MKPPANALSRCQTLPLPQAGDHYEQYLAMVIDLYYECAMRHDALAAFAGRV